MKFKRLPLLLSIASLLVLTSFVAFYPTGAPPAKTGSPGDGSNCTECHGGTATSVTGWITSNIPSGGYTPGQTYQITATNQLTGSGKFGFEVSPQNAAGTLLGTLAAGTNSQLVGSNKYVTHTNANTTVSSWTFNWTAPAAGTGTVTFYGAFAKGKPGPVRLSTLVVNELTVSPPPAAGPISGPASVCKNNNYTYTVGTIAGATTYVWSVPTGANIISGQGTTSISVNFGASSTSGNVSVYGSNSAGNGAPSNLAVTVNAAPAQPSAISGPAASCEGSSETYSVVNTSGVIYTWSVPAGSTITSGQGTSSITVTIGPNSGEIAVSPSNSCGSGTSQATTISVSGIPGQASAPMGPDVVDLANEISTNYSTAGASNGTTYQWEVSPSEAGSVTGTTTTCLVTWNGAFLGTVEIRVRASNDCGEGTWSVVKQTTVINTTALPESTTAGASIYPNPSQGQFTLNPGMDAEQVSVNILDASGKLVHRSQVAGRNATQMDVNLKAGIYVVVLSDGNKSVKHKLFIQ